MTDLSSDEALAAVDGDPGARLLDELGATYEAVQRGRCEGCGAFWMPEDIGGLWAVVLEHEDGCELVD